MRAVSHSYRIAAAAAALACIAGIGGAFSNAQAEAKGKAPTARCAVWDREASFAASVEQHDAAAFAAHLAKGAVFINGRPPHLHGEAEVIEGWRGIVDGTALVLRWHPEFVAIGGDGRTALSRGPFTMENPDVNSEARFRIGTYQSVWVKNAAGHWNVMFDGGGPAPRPASEEEVRAMQKSWTKQCPFVD